MSDVTAPGGAPRRPRSALRPSWHHVHDEAGPAGAADGGTSGPDAAGAGPSPVPETPPPAVPVTPLARLAPSRQPAMWLVLAGVVVSTAVAVLVGARAGCLVLAGLLAVAGLCRATIPGPGPVGITVRSRGLDVFFFLAPAVVIAFLALTIPPTEI